MVDEIKTDGDVFFLGYVLIDAKSDSLRDSRVVYLLDNSPYPVIIDQQSHQFLGVARGCSSVPVLSLVLRDFGYDSCRIGLCDSSSIRQWRMPH